MIRESIVQNGRLTLCAALTLVASVAAGAPSACIPEGATVYEATFSICVGSAGSESPTVRLHRVTAAWVEREVTWTSFGGSYDPPIEGSFVADGSGWRAVDVTGLVQAWVNGTYPNYGLLLEQGLADYTSYRSSEHSVVELRPTLEIKYVTLDGSASITIQRPGAEEDGVADAFIWEPYPNVNGGSSTTLYTGLIGAGEKQTLVRFDFEICGEPDAGCRVTGGGVDTDGNWDHSLENGQMVRNGSGNVPVGIDRAQFGGQAGANTGNLPQPSGEWTHHQQRGPSGSFTFHGGTASAPIGTEIYEIRCSDPGGCRPSGDPPSPAKQLDFDGIGTFQSIGKGSKTPVFQIPNANVTAEGRGNKTFNGTYHWFEVNIDDLGEPGGYNTGAPDSAECLSAGFGEKSQPPRPLGNCDCPDFYRITLYDGVDASDVVWLADGVIDLNSMPRGPENVIYQFYGYIDGGNLQIHYPTGYDLRDLSENWLAAIR